MDASEGDGDESNGEFEGLADGVSSFGFKEGIDEVEELLGIEMLGLLDSVYIPPYKTTAANLCPELSLVM